MRAGQVPAAVALHGPAAFFHIDLAQPAAREGAKLQLGHTTEKMTRRYAQPDLDKAKRAIESAAQILPEST